MIDPKEIKDIEEFCESLGWTPVVMENAIKMLEMWKWIKKESALYDDITVREAEEKFFPSLVTKTLSVKVKVPLKGGLARVTQIKKLIEKSVRGWQDVGEVTIDEEDC